MVVVVVVLVVLVVCILVLKVLSLSNFLLSLKEREHLLLEKVETPSLLCMERNLEIHSSIVCLFEEYSLPM